MPLGDTFLKDLHVIIYIICIYIYIHAMCMHIFTNNYIYIHHFFNVYCISFIVMSHKHYGFRVLCTELGESSFNCYLMKWCSHQSRLFARPTRKKTWESGYPSVPASNWKTDVPEFLRMLIICCSCSRYFFEDSPSGSVCTLEKVWAQTFRKYKNANHHRVQKQRTKSLRAFFLPSASGRSGNTQNLYQILDAQKTHK